MPELLVYIAPFRETQTDIEWPQPNNDQDIIAELFGVLFETPKATIAQAAQATPMVNHIKGYEIVAGGNNTIQQLGDQSRDGHARMRAIFEFVTDRVMCEVDA